jgi:hypothetical protein
LIKSGIS